MPGAKGEFSWIFFVPTIILLGLTLFFLIKNIRVMTTYTRTMGTIVRFESSTLKNGQTVYQTIVNYKATDGVEREAGSFTKASSVSSKEGDRVAVYYNPVNPTVAHVHTFRDSWLHIVILGTIGGILFLCWYGILMGTAVGAPPS